MIFKLGPITIMSTDRHRAYKNVVNAAYRLHQTIWYADDLTTQAEKIRSLDAQLSDAISYIPPSDIE